MERRCACSYSFPDSCGLAKAFLHFELTSLPTQLPLLDPRLSRVDPLYGRIVNFIWLKMFRTEHSPSTEQNTASTQASTTSASTETSSTTAVPSTLEPSTSQSPTPTSTEQTTQEVTTLGPSSGIRRWGKRICVDKIFFELIPVSTYCLFLILFENLISLFQCGFELYDEDACPMVDLPTPFAFHFGESSLLLCCSFSMFPGADVNAG